MKVNVGDRSGNYAEAARSAPSAVKVADGFHLVRNLTDARQRFFEDHQPLLSRIGVETEALTEGVDLRVMSGGNAGERGASRLRRLCYVSLRRPNIVSRSAERASASSRAARVARW